MKYRNGCVTPANRWRFFVTRRRPHRFLPLQWRQFLRHPHSLRRRPMELTRRQLEILAATGHMLVKGGPGSGKTTVAIIKAADLA